MLPKYVWVFEFSLIDDESPMDRQFAPALSREILGEFLVDPTTPPYAFRCLACRIGEYGYDYRRGIEEPTATDWLPSRTFALDDMGLLYQCYRPEGVA